MTQTLNLSPRIKIITSSAIIFPANQISSGGKIASFDWLIFREIRMLLSRDQIEPKYEKVKKAVHIFVTKENFSENPPNFQGLALWRKNDFCEKK